jgi:hypothetical protein
LQTTQAEAIETTTVDPGGFKEPAMDTETGRTNFPPKGKKPIIDQMTDLAAQAAGA